MHASMGRLRDDMADPGARAGPRRAAIHPRGERWLTYRPRRRRPTVTARRREATSSASSSPTCARTGRSCAQEWARRIAEARLLTALTQEEIFSEATSVYDNYVEVLETGSVEALQDYARNLSERIIPRGVEIDEVVSASCCCCATCWPARCSRSTRRTSQLLNQRARRLRAGRQPHRQHRGRQLRPGARARHPPAAGGDPRALDAGPPGPRAAADPPDHRRARRPARPPAHRAAPARDPHQPRQGGRDRHHRRARRSTRRWPTTSCRRSTRRG